MKSILFVALLLFILPIDVATAQSTGTGFVTCTGTDCSACNFVELLNLLIIWLFGIVFVIFAVLMTVAGFGLVTSGGNQSALDAAKTKFSNAIIGILIMMAAWIIVDTLLRGTLAGGAGEITGYGPWAQVQCMNQTTPVEGGGTGELPQAGGTPPNPAIPAACTDDAALMARYSGSPIGVEAPGLRTMISCYLADPAVAAITDRGQLYTVDRSHPRCSLTNGNSACGPCSHSNNSMHYGRGSGLGARAVDFNARGGTESELHTRLRARQAACGGTILFEGDHSHISL